MLTVPYSPLLPFTLATSSNQFEGIKSTIRPSVLGGHDVEPIPEAVAYQFKVPAEVMKTDPKTASLVESGAMQSWYGPGRQIIGGPSSHGAYYVVTLTVYPKDGDNIADSLDIISANSSSSYRLGDIYTMRKSIAMYEYRVRKFVEMVKPDDCFLWKLAHLPKLNTWVSPSGKTAVLGDAAHGMVPHLGMVVMISCTV